MCAHVGRYKGLLTKGECFVSIGVRIADFTGEIVLTWNQSLFHHRLLSPTTLISVEESQTWYDFFPWRRRSLPSKKRGDRMGHSHGGPAAWICAMFLKGFSYLVVCVPHLIWAFLSVHLPDSSRFQSTLPFLLFKFPWTLSIKHKLAIHPECLCPGPPLCSPSHLLLLPRLHLFLLFIGWLKRDYKSYFWKLINHTVCKKKWNSIICVFLDLWFPLSATEYLLASYFLYL